MNTTVQNHLDSKRLEAYAAPDREVLGFWKKAVVALTDATNTSSSLENRLLRAYDAARLAALRIMQAAGYRPRGSDSHHYVTFDVARSVVGDPDLRRALDTMNSLRKVRHEVEYESEGEVNENTLSGAFRAAEQIIELGALHLGERRPHLVLPERG